MKVNRDERVEFQSCRAVDLLTTKWREQVDRPRKLAESLGVRVLSKPPSCCL